MSNAEGEESGQSDWRRLLTAGERTAMLLDIAAVSLASGARLFPKQPWSDLAVAAGPGFAPKSPIEQLGFIEYLLPILTQALQQIAWSPLTMAVGCTRAVLPERARRVTASAWMAHARRSPSSRSVDEAVTFLSHDTSENRAVQSFLMALERDCRAIAQIADAEEEAEAAERAIGCAWRLKQLLCAPLWAEVRPKRSDWTLPPTQREMLRPDYARLSQERIRYRKRFGFDWDQLLLTLPPRETWRLYEVWCFFTVLRVLNALGWDFAPPQEAFAVREGRLIFTLAPGNAGRISLRSARGRSLTLTYNQTFAEGRESLSHTMQPDITLSDGARVWILDAKFKPYAEPGEEGGDINQMHAYRDAIVDIQETRNVACGWCLYAGLSLFPNRARITYGREADTPVGALCLRPGSAETVTNLRRLLAHWLSEYSAIPAPTPSPGT